MISHFYAFNQKWFRVQYQCSQRNNNEPSKGLVILKQLSSKELLHSRQKSKITQKLIFLEKQVSKVGLLLTGTFGNSSRDDIIQIFLQFLPTVIMVELSSPQRNPNDFLGWNSLPKQDIFFKDLLDCSVKITVLINSHVHLVKSNLLFNGYEKYQSLDLDAEKSCTRPGPDLGYFRSTPKLAIIIDHLSRVGNESI